MLLHQLITTIDDEVRDKKLQYDINGEAVKISALSSGQIDKYEYLTNKEILPPGQSRVLVQAKFTYSSLKAIKNQVQKQKKSNGNAWKTIS